MNLHTLRVDQELSLSEQLTPKQIKIINKILNRRYANCGQARASLIRIINKFEDIEKNNTARLDVFLQKTKKLLS